ncbi:6-bladed beta-propeller [Fodinibius halophilus]|uniref:6-bladed beta-propeller n=1 Tax=Fodinibius halophilus TaxID=1736908 RepID=A0A6M1T3U5_9BACT|nr:6-bladed beta-propeller [Fodinibius halophilus]NGP90086.1 6-bladed beta-propeller [Fodinibius halophilus]
MRVFFICSFVFMVFGCGNRADQSETYSVSTVNKQSLELNHIYSFPLENSSDATVLANPYPSVRLSNDGNRIAIKDMLQDHIVLYDSLGNHLATIGKQGKGPREFVEITSWNFDENKNLLVFDAPQKLVKIFNSNGKLKKSSKVFTEDQLLGFGISFYAHDSLIYMGILEAQYSNLENAEYSKLIALNNYEGELQKTIGKYDPYVSQATMYTSQPVFDIDFKRDKIYSTQMNSYRVQVYDLKDHNRMAYFGYKSDHFIESEEKISPFHQKSKRREMGLNQSYTNGIYITSRYILIYFRNLTEDWYQSRSPQDKKHFISVYDRYNYNFIGEISLPYSLQAVHKDRLYLVENNNPDNYTIGIYKIQTAH